jgi:hypothetical protein
MFKGKAVKASDTKLGPSACCSQSQVTTRRKLVVWKEDAREDWRKFYNAQTPHLQACWSPAVVRKNDQSK